MSDLPLGLHVGSGLISPGASSPADGGFFSSFGGFFDALGSTLGGVLEGIEDFVSDIQNPLSDLILQGQSPIFNLGGNGNGAGEATVTQQPTPMNGGQMANGALTTCPPGTFFKQPGTTMRARHEIVVENPLTGKVMVYRNMGRPLLYSGELASVKRVNKVAARARRASPRKSRRKR